MLADEERVERGEHGMLVGTVVAREKEASAGIGRVDKAARIQW